MSARARFTTPFAPLQLAESEVQTLEQLSRVILRNYMAQYEEHERASGSDVDERVWKPVKEREDVRIFAQRKHQSDGTLRRALASFSGSGAVPPSSDLPVMLAIGSMPGTVDDVLYGVTAPTIEAIRLKTAYIADHVGDAAVLQTIVSPTQDEPFQSLTLKWTHVEQSLLLRPAVNNRDFVYMERTGIAHTSKGERLGFQMIHSVHLPQTHELPSVIRGNVSVCGIFRDDPERRQVRLYVRSVVDPRGSAMHSLVAIVAAEMLALGWRYVECAYLKKLMQTLRRNRKTRALGGSRDSTFQSTATTRTTAQTDLLSPQESKLGPCVACSRTPQKAGNLLRKPHKRKCTLCSQYVCSSCRIKKTLNHVASASAALWQQQFAFCAGCYSDVCRSSALVAAQEELAAHETDGASSSEAPSIGSDLSSLSNSE